MDFPGRDGTRLAYQETGADDGLALIDHLGLADYDLAGHSLGGRTVARMLIRGATPRRAVISGQGLEAMQHAAERTGWYRDPRSHRSSRKRWPGSSRSCSR